MTDWTRVEKLRTRGMAWDEIADDPRVGFSSPSGTDAGRALKALYFRRRSTTHDRSRGRPRPVTDAGNRSWLHLSRRGIVVLALAAAFVAVVGYLLVQPPGESGAPTGWVGKTAPGFSLAIANQPGTFTLSSARGHRDVLLFFNEGLSCSPCLTQMEELDANDADFTSLNVEVVQITGDSQSDMATWASNDHVTNTIVCADPTLQVSNLYDTTGAAVSMMPGSAPGHTFILVNESGTVIWRADYGPSDMSVPLSEILQNVRSAQTQYG